MTGHHEVQAFQYSEETLVLPNDWKPFASFVLNGYITVVCRKWVRDEKTQTEAEPQT